MKKKCLIKEVSILLIVVLLLSSAGVLAANTTSQKVEIEGRIMSPTENTWYVPDDFGTIQGAIDSDLVKDGDTIYVRSGTYYEHIAVDKSIKLIGENRETTIIDANGEDYAVSIDDTSYVVISGFTIQGSTSAGVSLHYNPFNPNDNIVTDNTITGNIIIITNNGYGGISLWYSSGNTISDNIIENNEDGEGIELYESSGNDILGNTITNSDKGIGLYASSGNDISGNTIGNNRWAGIMIYESSGNDIWGNTITNNNNGIWIYYSNDNTIGGATDDLKNTISNNQVGIFIDPNSEGYSIPKLRENNKFNNNGLNILKGFRTESGYLPLNRLLPGC